MTKHNDLQESVQNLMGRTLNESADKWSPHGGYHNRSISSREAYHLSTQLSHDKWKPMMTTHHGGSWNIFPEEGGDHSQQTFRKHAKGTVGTQAPDRICIRTDKAGGHVVSIPFAHKHHKKTVDGHLSSLPKSEDDIKKHLSKTGF